MVSYIRFFLSNALYHFGVSFCTLSACVPYESTRLRVCFIYNYSIAIYNTVNMCCVLILFIIQSCILHLNCCLWMFVCSKKVKNPLSYLILEEWMQQRSKKQRRRSKRERDEKNSLTQSQISNRMTVVFPNEKYPLSR